VRIRIGHLSTFYHTALLLMARNAQLPGSEIEWQLFGTGPAIINAFEKEELDLAYIGLPPAIIGIDRGAGITCIAGGHVEGTVIIGKEAFGGFPEVRSLGEILGQFRGLKIGVPGKGSIHDVILTDCLERFSLHRDIEVLNFAWADQVLEAAVKGEVAGAFGTPALAVAIERYAKGKILYPPSLLWPDNPSYGIIAENEFLHQNRHVSEKFLIMHEEATAFFRTRPAEAAKVIAQFVGYIDEEFVMKTLEVSPKYCAQLTDAYRASTMKFVETMKKLGYISRLITCEEIFETSLIRKVHPGKDHYEKGLE
jgi:NitT/TauT family transport system substrate-binding protein